MPQPNDSRTRPVTTPSDRAAIAAARQIVADPECFGGEPALLIEAWNTLHWARGQRINRHQLETMAGLRPAPVAAILAARMLGAPA
jgi:hypothetical protein